MVQEAIPFGDWHGNVPFILETIRKACEKRPNARLLHVGV